MTTLDKFRQSRWLTPAIALALGLATVLTFFGVWQNGFVDYDDYSYVRLNPNIAQGLNWETVAWAFTYVDIAHWVPLTWLSYALDYQISGLNPAGFHVTNLVLHTANVVLLFLLLRKMTGSVWPSALAAALFGLHPLRVESVAWVAERKDVLSGFFFMLTLLAYVKYAKAEGRMQRAEIRAQNPESAIAPHSTLNPQPSTPYYLLALVLFALGLMSKSILVTLPIVLLLLDYWPLHRMRLSPAFTIHNSKSILVEKLPFFALSAASCLVTFLTQERETTTNAALLIPLPHRLGNGVLACVTYLKQTVWPDGLAVFYPPIPARLWDVWPLAATAFLAVVTLLAVLAARRRPFIPVGWFWFLVVLVPVCGVVQVGDMIQADRYTYLPSIGLCLIISWSVASVAFAVPRLRLALAAAACSTVLALTVAAHNQVSVWRNTRTLFTQAAAVTRNNHMALTVLAGLDLKEGRLAEAVTSLERVLQFAPRYPTAEYYLGEALQRQGKMSEALPHLELATGPDVAIPAKARLVLSLLDAGRLTEAQTILNQLLAARPHDPGVAITQAALLNEQGRSAEAAQLFRRVLASYSPTPADNPTLGFEIAELYALVGESRKAVPYYSNAVKMSPSFTNALNNFAWLLATDADDQMRNGPRAIELAERACRLTDWKQPLLMGTLAAAYAEAGRFDEAVKTARRARDTARADQLEAVATRNDELIRLYQAGKPYRETRAP